MTPDQTNLVRASWEKLAQSASLATRTFYQRLFEIDSEARALFAGADMNSQGQKLLGAIQIVVDNANRLDSITPVLRELGRRHAGYGVHKRHYDSVGAALFWTFERVLGADFTEPVRAAWTQVYVHVRAAMQNAPELGLAPTGSAAFVGSSAFADRAR